MIQGNQTLTPILGDLVNYWRKNIPELLETLTSDIFFLPLSELMDREIFSKKRHEKKVTFSDAKAIRDRLEVLLAPIFLVGRS